MIQRHLWRFIHHSGMNKLRNKRLLLLEFEMLHTVNEVVWLAGVMFMLTLIGSERTARARVTTNNRKVKRIGRVRDENGKTKVSFIEFSLGERLRISMGVWIERGSIKGRKNLPVFCSTWETLGQCHAFKYAKANFSRKHLQVREMSASCEHVQCLALCTRCTC